MLGIGGLSLYSEGDAGVIGSSSLHYVTHLSVPKGSFCCFGRKTGNDVLVVYSRVGVKGRTRYSFLMGHSGYLSFLSYPSVYTCSCS